MMPRVPAPDDDKKVLLRNKKARHDYFVEEQVEAGIALVGSEVKSLRDAMASIGDAWADVTNGEMWLHQLQINEYPWANRWNHQPKRDRKLLLHRREIDKLGSAVAEKGYTLLPLEIYLKGGRVKVLLGLCRGKKQHDKRQAERERESKREIDRAMSSRHRR